VVFFGTPLAAVPTLQALEGAHDVGLVVTQPDRPRGRSKKPMPPPVKEWALEHGLPVAQPDTLEELFGMMGESGPFDVGVVVAYGRILRPEVLEAPEHGLVNVHFSLLPRWRGAAPVSRALMAGDEMTGVSIMRLDEGLDTGPIITAQAVDIQADDDAGTLTEKLAHVGARLLLDVLPRYLRGEALPVPQSDDGATYADKIDSGERPIDVTGSARAIVDKVRGLAPDPAATLDIDGTRHKVLQVEAVEEDVDMGTWSVVHGQPIVGLGDGAIALVTLQAPGKTSQSGRAWANGQRRTGGSVG
jgi:methionyl-tRNA formyltransferase